MILPPTIDKHTLALISIIGSSFDVLGALYLAYDLFGWRARASADSDARGYVRGTLWNRLRLGPRTDLRTS